MNHDDGSIWDWEAQQSKHAITQTDAYRTPSSKEEEDNDRAQKNNGHCNIYRTKTKKQRSVEHEEVAKKKCRRVNQADCPRLYQVQTGNMIPWGATPDMRSILHTGTNQTTVQSKQLGRSEKPL